MANATAKLTLRLVTEGTEQLTALEKQLGRLSRPVRGGGALRLVGTEASQAAGKVEQMGQRLTRALESRGSTPGAIRNIRTLEQETERLSRLAEQRRITNQAKSNLGFDGGSFLAGHGFLSRSRQMLGVFRDATVAAYGLRFAVGAVASVGRAMIDPFMDFEAKMAEVRNKGGFDLGTTARIAEQAKQIGRTTQFSPTQAASAGVELAAAGLNAPGIQTALPSVLRFAQASGLSTEQSSTALVETMSQFKLAAKDFEHIGDVMVKTANMSTISVGDMTESLKYVGPIAATAGMPLEKISAIIGLLGERGVKGSQAGTGLREIIISMVHPLKTAKKAMEEIGLTKKEMQAGLTDLPTFLAKLNEKMNRKKLNTPQRLEVERMLFGAEALTSVESIMTAMGTLGTDGVSQLKAYENGVNAASGAMKSAADIAGNTLAGKMAKLHAAFETAQVTLGEKLAPKLAEFLPKLTSAAVATGDWINKNGSLISQLIEIAPLLVATGIGAKAAGAAFKGLILLEGMFPSLGVLAATGTSFAGTFMGAFAAGIAGYALTTAVLKALDIDMSKVGAKVYEWIHGTSGDSAPKGNHTLSVADAIRAKQSQNAVDATRPRINVASGEQPSFAGTLDINISQDGRPTVYNLRTKGPLAVGVNAGP